MLVDRLLRQGAMTELVGPLSSGRTSLLTLCLRDVTRRGALAALVDTDHAFDAVGAAASGVELSRVLWVRAEGHRRHALKAADLLVRCPGFALVALDLGESPPRLPIGAAYRLRLAARRSGVALLIVGARRVVGGAAAVAAAAVERCEPALREQPLAVVTGAPPATRVVEANVHARTAGVRPGLNDAEAGVRCPGLVRRPVSADAEAAARHALLEACLSVSPRLEDAGPGAVHVDLAGLG